ncbi:ABC transporter substrate-binding protein [Pseudonocardia halophobica]|uniref:ABC transporter substrate-binding protein n=1 Tax=Pseudonocardia halophobica TaxID=29401 RepID=UPI003D8D6B90
MSALKSVPSRGPGAARRRPARRRGRATAVAFLAVGLATVTACAGPSGASRTTAAESTPPACAPLAQREHVRIGVAEALSLGTPFQAAGGGWNDEQNLDVEMVVFPSTQEAVALVGVGQLDAAIGGMSANLFSAIDSGVDVRVVGGMGALDAANLPSGLFVRSDLVEDGSVRSVADLKGRSVAYSGTTGSPASWYVSLLLQQGGLALDDVRGTRLSYPDMPTALQNGQVDAAFVSSPFAAQVEEQGLGRRVGDHSVIAGHTNVGIVLGPNLLEQRSDVGCALVRANMRAAAQELTPGYSTRQEVVDAFVTYAHMPADLVRSTPEYLYSPTLDVRPETLQSMQEIFIAGGSLDLAAPLPYERVVDVPFHDAVVASIPST